jgi:hypothetical protein
MTLLCRIARRSGITPIRSVAGAAEAVPFRGSLRISRSWHGLNRYPRLDSAIPWRMIAAPVMIGDALEVPLNVEV